MAQHTLHFLSALVAPLTRFFFYSCIGLVVLVTGCARSPRPTPDADFHYSYLARVLNCRFAGARLQISYMGDPPRLVNETCIRGDGLVVEIRDRSSHLLWSTGGSEAEPPIAIDFAEAAHGRLQATYYTRDPRQPLEDYVPFFKETVHLGPGNSLRSESVLLLEKEPFDPARANQLVRSALQAISSQDNGALDVYGSSLASLRNMALDSPDKILHLLEDLQNTGRADGACAEILSDYIGEVQTVREILAK